MCADDHNPSEPPSLAQRAWSFAQAVQDFVADGCTTVSREQYQERLTVCEWCERREGNFCNACGCVLALKAGMRSEDCPLQRWPELTVSEPTT
jgi:hypothetical protein